MIKCKEDLRGKYVECSDKELLELFLGVCERFGLKWYGGSEPRGFEPYMNRIGVEFDLTLRQGFVDDCYKPLTLSDLKPKRTRTEYEKVTESIFDLRDEFERGDLYTKKFNQEWHKIKTEEQLGNLLSMNDDPTKNGIYRKAEKEIDWRDESHGYLANKTGFHWSTPVAEVINDESGCFLELCRVALRANGEIE